MEVPFFLANHDHDALSETFKSVLRKEQFILGVSVAGFETAFASYTGARHCVGTGNGLDALSIALKALKLQPGDEVIVPSNTYIATWLAVSNQGLIPVPVEPSVVTMNIDPAHIAEKITARTRAIMPVHLFGLPCTMDKIMDIAKKNDLYVVEDFAQAHGSLYHGKMCGTFGHINGTSFYPTKNLGALGDAGAITTSDEKLASLSRKIANYGSSERFINEVEGVNSRLDEIQAAFLIQKLKGLDANNLLRRKTASLYIEGLGDIAEITLPYEDEAHFCTYHQFVIRTEKRNELKQFLIENQVQTMVHYPVPPHLQEAYNYLGFTKGNFPVAEKIARTSLSLPVYPGISELQVEYVVGKIREFLGYN